MVVLNIGILLFSFFFLFFSYQIVECFRYFVATLSYLGKVFQFALLDILHYTSHFSKDVSFSSTRNTRQEHIFCSLNGIISDLLYVTAGFTFLTTTFS